VCDHRDKRRNCHGRCSRARASPSPMCDKRDRQQSPRHPCSRACAPYSPAEFLIIFPRCAIFSEGLPHPP
ncbi:hypothetical protein B0H17DRAFT_1103619, partial [Mycena rosella]